jgi:protein-S-isoprenylcysteine O-methyltransferase Ste14
LEISKVRHGLGSEHPLCDRIQLLMLILFFGVWGIDYLSFFIFGYSTVIFQALTFPLLLVGTILFLGLGSYLVSKSHKAVLEQVHDPPRLVDSGVYAWVRHPMYLGILLFCLAFIFISISLVSIAVWIAFFVFYDRMAKYEEKSLIEILGGSYTAYQKRVSKWFPGVW